MKGYDSGMVKKYEAKIIATKIIHSRQSQFTILLNCFTLNTVTIIWGDGNSDPVTTNGYYYHTYPSSGVWIVQIMGVLGDVKELSVWGQSVSEIMIHPQMCNLISVTAPYNTITSLDVSMCQSIGKIQVNNNANFTTLILPEYSTDINSVSWDIQANNTAISSIILPPGKIGVNKIYAYDCSNLITVDIKNCLDPSGVIGVNELKVYNCSSLTTLDITGIGYANFLYCYNNPLITNIDTHFITSSIYINLTQNPGLTSIDLGKLTSCSMFNVGNNTNLTTLNVDKLVNVTQGINAGGCPKLTSLMFNSLTSAGGLNIAGNTSLQNLYYEKATISGTFLINDININSLRLYFQASFYLIQTDNFKGTTLDLSLATSATSTLRLVYMPNITSLDISNIGVVGTCHISDNPKITSLLINFTRIDSILSIANLPLLTNLQFTNTCSCPLLSINNTGVNNIDLSSFNSVYYFKVTRQTNLSISSFPQFKATDLQLDISQNYGIVSMPSISYLRNVTSMDFRKNGLTQAQVDAILNQCLEISLYDTNVKLYLYKYISGTSYGIVNAQPSAQGLADKATLISRGWTIDA